MKCSVILIKIMLLISVFLKVYHLHDENACFVLCYVNTEGMWGYETFKTEMRWKEMHIKGIGNAEKLFPFLHYEVLHVANSTSTHRCSRTSPSQLSPESKGKAHGRPVYLLPGEIFM